MSKRRVRYVVTGFDELMFVTGRPTRHATRSDAERRATTLRARGILPLVEKEVRSK